MNDQYNTTGVTGGAYSNKTGYIKGVLIKTTTGADAINKRTVKTELNLQTNYSIADSLAVELYNNFEDINFKFTKSVTLIKIYIIIDNNRVYSRGFYKDEDYNPNTKIIKRSDYVSKSAEDGYDDDITDDDENTFKKIKDYLKKIKEGCYITYTINNYKNYFIYINGNGNSNAVATDVFDTFLSHDSYHDDLIKIMKSIHIHYKNNYS